MPTPLCVRADARSILRNILNYFSDNHAYVQELLQNARRAEASEVRVEIDTQAGTLVVIDNGHGVIDPQDLLNIGKSEWNESVKAERPAGMGLFSVFKLGGLAEVRSGRWRLRMDYAAMCHGEHAEYEGLQSVTKGTQVRVSGFHHQFGSEEMPHVETYVGLWTRQAEFMPFRTTIVVDGVTQVIEAFNPRAVPRGALRINTAWGWIDLHTEAPQRGENRHDAMLIQQAIATTVHHDLHIGGLCDGPWVRIHARPGTANFALPDRDKILDDAKYKSLVKEIRKACVDAVVGHIGDFHDTVARQKMAGLVYAWDKLRVVELPLDLQYIRVQQDRDYLCKMTRAEVASQLATGVQACSFEPGYHTAFELLPVELLLLPVCEAELFKAMFPASRVIEDMTFAITADDRSDLLWRCGPVTLKLDNGESRVVQPKGGVSVLTGGDLDGEFVPDNRERANFRSGEDFAVAHTCAGAVDCPNLDPWVSWHEEEMDSEQAEECWRTSDYAVHIASTWPGVPAKDVTLDELRTLLVDRFGKPRASVRLKDTTFEIDWGDRISIDAATVEFGEDGEVYREVRLREVDGYLQEVKP